MSVPIICGTCGAQGEVAIQHLASMGVARCVRCGASDFDLFDPDPVQPPGEQVAEVPEPEPTTTPDKAKVAALSREWRADPVYGFWYLLTDDWLSVAVRPAPTGWSWSVEQHAGAATQILAQGAAESLRGAQAQAEAAAIEAGWEATTGSKVAGESTAMECLECGRKFRKRLGPSTSEVRCPACGGYDTYPAEEPTTYVSKQAAAIGPELVEKMRALITPLDTPERRERYRRGDFPRADSVKDLDTRYRWDLCWESGANRVVWEVGPSLKDAHIDTALRSIVPPLATQAAKTAQDYDTPTWSDFQYQEEHGVLPGQGSTMDEMAEFYGPNADPEEVEEIEREVGMRHLHEENERLRRRLDAYESSRVAAGGSGYYVLLMGTPVGGPFSNPSDAHAYLAANGGDAVEYRTSADLAEGNPAPRMQANPLQFGRPFSPAQPTEFALASKQGTGRKIAKANCPQCGTANLAKGITDRDGSKVDYCSQCGYKKKARTASALDAKVAEIAKAVRDSNPGMDTKTAIDVAFRTVHRYPRLAGAGRD